VFIESSTTSVIEKSKSKRRWTIWGAHFGGEGGRKEARRGKGVGGVLGVLHKFKKRGMGMHRGVTLHVPLFDYAPPPPPQIAMPFDHKYLWCKAWV
jgi:hypothetical protein